MSPLKSGVIPWQCTAPRLFYRNARLNLAPATDSQLSGGQAVQYTGVGAAYNITADDYVLGVNSGTGAWTLTLPTAALEAGKAYLVMDIGGNAAVNNITVDTAGAETINGGADITLATNYGCAFIFSDGTNWFATII